MAVNWWQAKQKPRQPIGYAKKTMVQSEAAYARTLEDLFRQHRLDYWHCTVSQRSQPGFPDYVILGNRWLAFLELKARSMATNKKGVVSTAQERYKESIEAAGAEWVTFLLPDQWEEAEEWLIEHTGIVIRGYGRTHSKTVPA